MHVTRGCSVIMQVWVTSSLGLSRATLAFTSVLTGEDARNQRPWSDLLFPNTYKSKRIATEKRKGRSSLCRLIKGSRGSRGLGRYRGRKEIAAGSQSDIHTYHRQPPPSSTNQFTIGKPAPEIKTGGGGRKPHQRQYLEAETKSKVVNSLGCGRQIPGPRSTPPGPTSPRPHLPLRLPPLLPLFFAFRSPDMAPSCDSSDWNVGVLTLLELKPFNSPSVMNGRGSQMNCRGSVSRPPSSPCSESLFLDRMREVLLLPGNSFCMQTFGD